jgi:pilus assembly protein Flp/PilA
MKKLLINLDRLFKAEDGQGMVEYGLIIGLVSIAAIAALVLLGPQIKGIFESVTAALTPPAA